MITSDPSTHLFEIHSPEGKVVAAMTRELAWIVDDYESALAYTRYAESLALQGVYMTDEDVLAWHVDRVLESLTDA